MKTLFINSEQTRQDLLMAIAVKRQELINTGMNYGFTDERTIKCSWQLDSLLNLTMQNDYNALELTG